MCRRARKSSSLASLFALSGSLEKGRDPACSSKTCPGHDPDELGICCMIHTKSSDDFLIYLVGCQCSEQCQRSLSDWLA
jgi:hypothetical protein